MRDDRPNRRGKKKHGMMYKLCMSPKQQERRASERSPEILRADNSASSMKRPSRATRPPRNSGLRAWGSELGAQRLGLGAPRAARCLDIDKAESHGSNRQGTLRNLRYWAGIWNACNLLDKARGCSVQLCIINVSSVRIFLDIQYDGWAWTG
jgi:hypothetical protein